MPRGDILSSAQDWFLHHERCHTHARAVPSFTRIRAVPEACSVKTLVLNAATSRCRRVLQARSGARADGQGGSGAVGRRRPIRSESLELDRPSVIILTRYVKPPRNRRVMLSRRACCDGTAISNTPNEARNWWWSSGRHPGGAGLGGLRGSPAPEAEHQRGAGLGPDYRPGRLGVRGDGPAGGCLSTCRRGR